MIQAITETNLTTYLQTEDNRIDTSVGSDKIRHLIKFTNDMNGYVKYGYARTETISNRYTSFLFNYHATPDVYTGRINLFPAGYWKYEAYEVAWGVTPIISEGKAPVTELDVLTPASATNGVVKGLVTKGLLNLTEKDGTEQVQYVQNAKSVQTLTIAYEVQDIPQFQL